MAFCQNHKCSVSHQTKAKASGNWLNNWFQTCNSLILNPGFTVCKCAKKKTNKFTLGLVYQMFKDVDGASSCADLSSNSIHGL